NGAGGGPSASTGGASSGGAVQPMQRQPFFWEQPESSFPPPGSALHQVLRLLSTSAEPSATGTTLPLLVPPPDLSQTHLIPYSPLQNPSRYTPLSDSLTEHREPKSRPASFVARTRRDRRVRPPPVRSEHTMALHPSSIAQHPVLPSPPAYFLLGVPNPVSDLTRAASPTVTCCLATLVSDPTFLSASASALFTELVDFAATCRLDHFASHDSDSDCPPSVGGELVLGCDVFEDRQVELECLVAAVPHLAAMLCAPWGDPNALDIQTPRSYAEVITAQHDYELHSLDFSTAFLQGSLHEEIWLHCQPGFTGSFPEGTQWSLQRYTRLSPTWASVGEQPNPSHQAIPA
ncbi:unnamed protein product, partial [Closterium sp. NIES-53]